MKKLRNKETKGGRGWGKIIFEGKIDGKIERGRQKRNWERAYMTLLTSQ